MAQNKKTAGIITMHRVHNFGSMLQALALQKAVENLGFEAEIIDYNYPNAEHLSYYSTVRQPIHVAAPRPSILSRIKNKILLNLRPTKPNNDAARGVNFYRFMKSSLRLSRHYKSRFELWNEPPRYNVYITGSDQVWNPDYIGFDTSFMLGFASADSKKIAYAPSISLQNIPKAFQSTYKQSLAGYSAISARESTSAGLLKEMTGNEIPVVVDPTLLLNRNQWFELLGIEDSAAEDGYFIVYLLDYKFNPYPEVFNVIERAHKQFGGKIVVLHGKTSEYMRNAGVMETPTADPREMIEYFSKARFVITTSFHGSMFALNFGIPFLALVNHKVNDSRLCDSLSQYSASLHAIPYNFSGEHLPPTEISTATMEAISRNRQFSIDFLKQALL